MAVNRSLCPDQDAVTPLDFPPPQVFIVVMNATLSSDGQIVIPQELRENAQIKPGDTLDIQLYKGTIVLRKHQPLTPKECAALLERSHARSDPTLEDDAAVEHAVREVRARQR